MTPFVGAFFLPAIELCAMLRLRPAAMWGSLASCAPVVYRRSGRVANPPQDSILPHMKATYPICAKAFSIAALVAANASAGAILRTASLKGSARTGPS